MIDLEKILRECDEADAIEAKAEFLVYARNTHAARTQQLRDLCAEVKAARERIAKAIEGLDAPYFLETNSLIAVLEEVEAALRDDGSEG